MASLPHPLTRRQMLQAASALPLAALPAAAQTGHDLDPPSFSALLAELWPQAEAKGITRRTFDLAFTGLTPDARVIAITQREPEYGKPVGDYIAGIASAVRVAAGKDKAALWSTVFDQIEQRYGVDRWSLLGIWGIETSYGSAKDRWDIIRSIATLVNAGWRAPYFRGELLMALRILQDGDIARDKMLGSYAGAMGQPQFMPSSFAQYAVDFDGDGRRDIWSSVPDVLASMANYLQQRGWQAGVPWGFAVAIPQNFDYRKSRASFAEWNDLGVRRADGAAFPVGSAILFFPSGARGPAFLVTPNFNVIKTYNNSDVYGLAVGALGDRIRGAAPSPVSWPVPDPQLSRDQRIAMQKKLAELGYKVTDFEGRIDFDLRDVIRELQIKFGMLPDGHPTAAFLTRLAATK